MIVQLTGKIAHLSSDYVVLDVGGVGYELGISNTCAAFLADCQGEVTLLCRMVVREGDISLYGFESIEERTLFDRLRAISGVGPKMSLTILSTFTPAQLAKTVALDDVSQLTSIKGVGKKTAHRLLIELKIMFDKDPMLKALANSDTSDVVSAPLVSSVQRDVYEALLSMGFTDQEINIAMQGCEAMGLTTTSQMLNYALRRLGGAK